MRSTSSSSWRATTSAPGGWPTSNGSTARSPNRCGPCSTSWSRSSGSFKVFRMNRDVRFSADKSPYKTAHAAMTESDGGTANYVQISATGLFVGAGIYHMARDQLERFRHGGGRRRHRRAVEAAIAAARRPRLDIAGIEPALATAPARLAEGPPSCRAVADEGADHACATSGPRRGSTPSGPPTRSPRHGAPAPR